MHSAFRSTLLVLAGQLVLMASTVTAHAQEPKSEPKPEHKPEHKIDGRYRAEGVNPDGKPYRSVVDIEQDGDAYLVRWLEREGRTVAMGIGMVRGEFLSVSYVAGRQLGVVVYRIDKGPQLTGQWTILGADGSLWPETLTKAGVAASLEDPAAADTIAAADAALDGSALPQ